MLKNGPVLALNLLKVDESIDGPDQVNYAAMSLDANKPNPKVVDAGKKYGEYDYQANTIDEKLYGTKDGDIIPYVGKTPYSSLFDRSRFWIPSKNNLNAVAANGLITNDQTTFEHTNLLNFANVGTDEISILVYKPEGIKGYDITAKEWWGGDQNIPYGWIRPSDYISDYFIRVVAVKGNWTNYPVLSNDPIWQKYFDKNGIIKDKIGTFCSAEGITFIGSWSGVIIPDFVDKQGNYLYIESKVNAVTERTGLLMSINEDALQVISYDKNGVDVEVGEQTGTGQWVYDFDANAQAESELSEGLIEESGFLVDMVGHNLQNGVYNSEYYLDLNYVANIDGIEERPEYPYSYFLKDTIVTDHRQKINDGNVVPLSWNGRETNILVDDLDKTANLRVITGGYNDDGNLDEALKAYVVIDCSTNKPIKGNGSVPGVKAWYIACDTGMLEHGLTDEEYFDPTTYDTSISTLVTDCIKKLKPFAQKNVNISYNISDSITEFDIIPDSSGTSRASNDKIENILSEAEKTHILKLRPVPVVKDTNDIYVYQDVSIFYGAYGFADSKRKSVRLFNVTGGLKDQSYATVEDLMEITETSTPNRLVKISNVKTKD